MTLLIYFLINAKSLNSLKPAIFAPLKTNIHYAIKTKKQYNF